VLVAAFDQRQRTVEVGAGFKAVANGGFAGDLNGLLAGG
jgi:hypothetical protein